MSDPRDTLQGLFDEQGRYDNFGEMVMQVHVQGFRCHKNTLIDIMSPIAAFSGRNGTGKSTLLQLLAVSHAPPDGELRPFFIRDFFLVNSLDPAPFTPDATVTYKFWQKDRSLKPLTLSRSPSGGWNGYRRRPLCTILFAGVGLYLPRIEKRDFIVRNWAKLLVSRAAAVSDRIKQWTCTVLGQSYDSIESDTVVHNMQQAEIVCVARGGMRYSEVHMGFGEGRSQHLINALERLPDRSLVLIEEPETSLHASAQHELGRYLVDVAITRRHQLFLTTHSEYILNALPTASRIYLERTTDGIVARGSLTPCQVQSLLTDGHRKALTILVEDDCAQSVLREILRRFDVNFLTTVSIVPGGDKDKIANTVRGLRGTRLPVACVRDGDKEGAPRENIFKLPGTLPPEKEMFRNDSVVSFMREKYGVSLCDFAVRLRGVNHHEWFRRLSEYVSVGESVLTAEVARVYAAALPLNEVTVLVDLLKEASS